MTTFPRSPRVLRGGLVLLDPDTAALQRVIALQYNPDSLSRTLQIQGAGGESGVMVEALRLTGPPVETIRLEAEIDATDQLELPGQNQAAATLGVHPQLAALETVVYPSSESLKNVNRLAQAGTLEIAPVQAPLTLFVFGKARVLPVRITELSITEEAFDPALNPIRAKVSLAMRVFSVNDLGFDHKGGGLYLVHQQQREAQARLARTGTLASLGLKGIP